ncbi:porin family protein [bacterium]|nr:porin family protein [bacterium]MBU1615900.1 porin family protein [bacterium]
MRKCISLFIATVTVSLFLLVGVASAQEQKETKFGVGFQSSFPAWGISGMMDVFDKVSVQGILGAFGNLKTYAGRGIYRFRREPFWNTYGYGMVGMWSYSYFDDYARRNYVKETETAMGFGAGGGIEYNWQAFAPNLPPIWWNLEAGIGSVPLKYYNFSSFMIGVGAHYRF